MEQLNKTHMMNTLKTEIKLLENEVGFLSARLNNKQKILKAKQNMLKKLENSR